MSKDEQQGDSRRAFAAALGADDSTLSDFDVGCRIVDAATAGNADLVTRLLATERVVPGRYYSQAMIQAIKNDHFEALNAFFNSPNVPRTPDTFFDAFVWACGESDAHVLSRFLQLSFLDLRDENDIALKRAHENGNVSVVRLLQDEFFRRSGFDTVTFNNTPCYKIPLHVVQDVLNRHEESSHYKLLSRLREYLREAPVASNYLMENDIVDGQIVRSLLEVYPSFGESNTALGGHKILTNVRTDAALLVRKSWLNKY